MRTYRSGLRHRRDALVAASVGTAAVAITLLGILGPVMGLLGTAAAIAGPILHLPLGSITAAVTLAILASIGLLVGAFATRRTALAWALAITAWLLSLAASLWPLVAAALAAVDRVSDVIPWIAELLHTVL